MQAFLSYTRKDDEFFRRSITALRRAIELGVQVVTGDRNFEIFQDIDGIELGEKWQERLEEALSGARFLIPIITPLFFTSDACRNELHKFILHEKDLRRNDLILPIYFMTTPSIENPDQTSTDPLAQEIRKLSLEINSRQRRDWRQNARLSINNQKVRDEVLSLSVAIAQAIDRTKSVDLSPQANRIRNTQFREGAENIKDEVADTPKVTHKRVLWVDDRPEGNVSVVAALERYNLSIVLAKSTQEAISLMEASAPFDAMISDMGRPPDPRAGYTLLKAVRESGSEIPYFIYAGSRAPEHQRETLERGGQGTTNIASELIDMVLRSFEPTPVGVDNSESPANLNHVTVGIDKSRSLDNLNQMIVQQESLLGPLIAIGGDRNATILTFNTDQDPPAKHAVIILSGGTLPPGSTVVCQGKVFVAGQLTDATSIRPN
jgi:CheY-like chemotaxis protein